MNKCNPLLLVVVGMRVHVGLVAVRGPPRVAQPYVVLVSGSPLQLHALDAVAAEPVTRRKLRTHELPTLRVDSHYPTRVVAARLQYLQTLNAHISCNGLIPNVADDSTAFMGSLSANQGLQVLIEAFTTILIVANHLVEECACDSEFN